MQSFLSSYQLHFPIVLIYMLQNTGYQAGPYLGWFWRTSNFDSVMRRRDLVWTRPARLLVVVLGSCMFLQFAIGTGFILQWLFQDLKGGLQIGLALVLSYPIIWAHMIAVPLIIGRVLIVNPRQGWAARRAEKIITKHPGIRLAIVGSYGKTSMKQLLSTVLSEAGGLKVAATPTNKNVSVTYARFARSLGGDEDVLIIEYSEGRPGDVARFARRVHPTHAVITGVASAHLDKYKTIGAAAKDIFSVVSAVPSGQVYVNAESSDALPYLASTVHTYSSRTALEWRVSRIKVTSASISFTLSRGTGKTKRKLMLNSNLLGRHNVGPLAFAAAFAAELGLKDQQITAGIAKTEPLEHQMQPRYVNGALLVDDTYNSNLEGIQAGTALLAELPGSRKWYITPGLVERGRGSAAIHHRIGELIAAAKPDIVVLMDNSVQPYIFAGLHAAKFKGQIRIEADPLDFYTNLPHFLAAGDLVMMQNDWTDNKA